MNGAAASLLAPAGLAAQIALGKSSVYYPPTRTGLRGSHPGSYEVAHALASSGQKPARHRKLGEHGFKPRDRHQGDHRQPLAARIRLRIHVPSMTPNGRKDRRRMKSTSAFRRISIANSDAEGRAYLDAAVDAGWRAVGEQTA